MRHLICLLILTAIAWSQSTVITGTVADPAGNVYPNSPVTVDFFNPDSKIANWNNFPMTVTTWSTNADSFGAFSIQVPDLAFIAPAVGTFYKIKACANTVASMGGGGGYGGGSIGAGGPALPSPSGQPTNPCGLLTTPACPTSGCITGSTISVTTALDAIMPPNPIVSQPASLGGNNAFTGNNTFAGTSTFNGTETNNAATNLLGGGSFGGTFTGNFTESGNVAFSGTNTHSGSESFTAGLTSSLNFDQNCALYATINLCVAAQLALGGGSPFIPSGSKLSLTTAVTLGDSNGTPIRLTINKGGQLINNVPGGAAFAIAIGKQSEIVCGTGNVQTADSGRVPELVMGSSANIVDFVTNLDQTGVQQTANVTGCNFLDPGGATGTITGKVLHYVNLESNTRVRDTVIEGFPTGDILLENSTGIGTSAYALENVVANCSALANCTPLTIQGHPTGTVASVRIQGGQYVHAGTGRPQIDCEGAGGTLGNAPNGIYIGGGTYLEASFSNAIGVKLRDCHDVTIVGISAAGAGGSLFQLEQSAGGLTYNINWLGIENVNWTHTINDTINSVFNNTVSLPCASFTTTITLCPQTVGTGTATSAGTVINTGTSQTLAVTIAGATATDVATCATNSAFPATWQTGIQVLPPVVTANTVTLTFSNPTAGNITPAAQAFRCTAVR